MGGRREVGFVLTTGPREDLTMLAMAHAAVTAMVREGELNLFGDKEQFF